MNRSSIKSIFLIFTFILLVFASACNRQKCDRIGNIYLLSDKNLPIPFDSLKSLESSLNYLEVKYCIENEDSLPMIFYNLRKQEITKSARGSMPVTLEPVPCGIELEYDFNRILEIQLDGNNINIESQRMPLDSIAKYVYYQYLSYGRYEGFSQVPDGNGIWLIMEKARPISDLNPIIGKILEGYRVSLEYLSQGLYGKEICKLEPEEWEKLSKRMQLHLALKYSDEVDQ